MRQLQCMNLLSHLFAYFPFPHKAMVVLHVPRGYHRPHAFPDSCGLSLAQHISHFSCTTGFSVQGAVSCISPCEWAQRHCFHLTHHSSWQIVLDCFHTSLLIKQNIQQGRHCTALPLVVLGVLQRISELVNQSVSLQWWVTSHCCATSTTWNETVKTNYKTGPNLTRKLHIYLSNNILKMSWSDFFVLLLALVSV